MLVMMFMTNKVIVRMLKMTLTKTVMMAVKMRKIRPTRNMMMVSMKMTIVIWILVASCRAALLHHDLIHRVIEHLLHQLHLLYEGGDVVPLPLALVKLYILIAPYTAPFLTLDKGEC